MKTTNTLAQSELSLNVPPAAAPAEQKPRNYFIPTYSIRLVRDSSVKAETKLADSPERVAAIVRAYWEGELDREHLVCLMLNARSQCVGIHTASIGTLSSSLAHPREIFRAAIMAGTCAAIVAVHNHPSGDCTPSPDDRDTTRRLVRCGELIGINVLDHVIIAADSFFSFREHGLIG